MTRLQDFLNSPVHSVSKMGARPKVGDLFGIEIECEGRNVEWDGLDKHLIEEWAPHADGSLRNNHGQACEWVFNGPAKFERAVKRVDTLFDYFEKRKARLVTSNRTSTHVHFNMADKSAYQLINVFILFTILEDLFDRYCGEGRKGNLFCLSSRHAEDQLQLLAKSVFDRGSFDLFREDFRYCSLNLASINKFGTVEFRGMRGLDRREDVVAWLSIIKEFCYFACYTVKNPIKLIEQISVDTPVGFLEKIFSDVNFTNLTKGLEDHEIAGSVYEGLRLVQMLCYRIGTEFDGVKIKVPDFWAEQGDYEEQVVEDIPEPADDQVHARVNNQLAAVRGFVLAHPPQDRVEMGVRNRQAWFEMPRAQEMQIINVAPEIINEEDVNLDF